MSSSIKDIFHNNPELKELTLSCIERIILLRDQIQLTANNASQKDSAAVKIAHFTQCLKQLLSALIQAIESYRLNLKNEEKTKQFKNIQKLFDAIIKLHDELSILPKQDEPIELYRFLRIFNRYGIADHGNALNEDDAKSKEGSIKFVLYSVQDRGPSTYANTPLEKYETDTLKTALTEIYEDTPPNVPQESTASYHIRIRREETCAPLYWPVLAHEVGHQVMKLAHFQERKIEQAFSNFLEGDGDNKYHSSFVGLIERIREIFNDVDKTNFSDDKILRNWLTECWCDIYAYFATGPAFIYAQRNTFILLPNRDNDVGTFTHPPLYLRLLVLQEIAEIHQENLDERASINFAPLESFLSSWLLHADQKIQDEIHNVAQWFKDFFNSHFKMIDDNISELHVHIKELKRRSTVFTPETLHNLVGRLNKGYPIPSLSDTLNKLREQETSVHEIMLAAWISHDTSLGDEVANQLSEGFEKYRKGDINENWEVFTRDIVPVYKRFNQAVLRSLQISEWVSLLRPSGDRKEDLNKIKPPVLALKCDECLNCDTSLLVDHEIKELLITDQLKVIPLIDLDTQLGATSLDVRLGPTFQTYQPNQSGVVDFTDDESVENVRANSSIIDLDFKEGIVIAPGQFVLAHTMEYIGLPENVAAQIEGRSSFARLGIQVHMTACLIDPGFHGSVTFEIFNAGPNPIRLFPGYRVGQLRFFHCKKPNKPYNRKKNAKYKGLLIYSDSMLASDYEIERMKAVKEECRKLQ